MNYWIRAYNRKNFRVADFIREHGYIDWGMRNRFEVGDIVFLYITAPESRLSFMMEVTKINLDWRNSTDDSEYFISEEAYEHWLAYHKETKYVRYSFLKELNSPYLEYHRLMEHGLGGAPRSPRKLYPEAADYILSHIY